MKKISLQATIARQAFVKNPFGISRNKLRVQVMSREGFAECCPRHLTGNETATPKPAKIISLTTESHRLLWTRGVRFFADAQGVQITGSAVQIGPSS